MSEMVTRAFAGRESRGYGRALSRLDTRGQLEAARVEQVANVQVARVHAVAFVGAQALHAAAMVSDVERQLSQLTPEAAGRLAAISDLTALGLAQVVVDSVRKVSS